MASRHDLVHLVRTAAAEMSAEYERITARAREDPGTAGDQGEENWAELLRRWLPQGYHVVTKGRVIGTDGNAGPQVDLLVLSPSYPMGLLNTKLYVASGVVAAFECKITLRTTHVRRAVRNGVALRALAKPQGHAAGPIYGLLAHSHAVPSKRRHPAVGVSEALTRSDKELVSDPTTCLDFICVANLGTWALMRFVMGTDGAARRQLTTTYMGPLEPSFHRPDHPENDPIPLGRFLTGLLRRLAAADRTLAPIADYFSEVGLFGIGHGAPRTWDLPELSDALHDPVF